MKMWTPSQQPQQPVPRPGQKPGPRSGSKPPKAKLHKATARPPRTWVTVLKWAAIAGVSGALLLVATAAFVFWMFGRDPNLPDFKKLSDYQPRQVTTILDANDRRIGEIYGDTRTPERRSYVPYDKVPPIVFESFIAAEDNKFWTHGGVDYWGMFRAFIANIRAGKKTQGASTITQQVVKTFLLTPEKTFKRKIQEIILARRLEKSLTKKEILTLYVNQIYFGHGRYGIQEAARYYFAKDVSQLNAGEAAVLASMPKEPETLANALHGLHGQKPQRVKERQVYVLNQLAEAGKLTKQEAQKWIDAPIQIVKNPFPEMNTAPEWVKLAEDELAKTIGKDAVVTLGGKVRTTLDPSMQTVAQTALQKGLRAVDKRQKIGRPRKTLKADKVAEEIARLAKKLPKGGPQAKELYDAVVTEVFDQDHEVVVDLGDWKAALVLGTPEDARFNPPEDGVTRKPSERFKPGDVVEVIVGRDDLIAAATGDEADQKARAKPADAPKHASHRVAFPAPPEGAVVIIETKTRKVRALVGGYASKVKGLNRAFALRQPGSSFKPFVYAAAIDSGRYTPATTVNDAPEQFDLWKPKNYETGKFDGPVLLRYALAKSINTVAIRVTYDMKPPTIAALAKRMGIVRKALPEEMSIALGSGEVTPLDMTNAIATLAAGGLAAPPRFVDAIDGKPTAPSKTEQVLRPEVAYVVTDMMRSVVEEGTGHLAKALKIPVAGKTGTSNEARDVWFMGMTPDYVIGVWIGYDEPRTLGRSETGGTTAVPVFVDIAKGMSLPAKQFPRPAHVVEATIDKTSGLLSPEGAPKGSMRTEVFLEGTAPTEYAAKPGDVTDDNVVTGEYPD
jgi:penicillin-binding protein 1A